MTPVVQRWEERRGEKAAGLRPAGWMLTVALYTQTLDCYCTLESVCVCVCVCVCRLTAQLWGLIAVVQTVIISVTLPSLLDTAVVFTCKLSWLALRRGDVRGVG